ncbi:hypothetical protein WK53_20615 [Burkholderia ubonensis]|uniref:Uncharacterized protein n=2 Tax=Burkholderia ubonensis TaxID=101571 RepID=A0AAW3N5V4_9BURK|nr:hypothetical protein WK53_20615 [Burkholderia ubonensis]
MKRDSEGSFVLASDVGAGNSHADALTEERRQALGEALTEYFATLDSDAGIRAQNGRILRTFDYCDSRNVDDLIDRAIVPALAASPIEQPAAAPADLEGLRRAILTPRAIVRDKDGMLSHPAVPYLDEDVNYETFFAAFGIESAFIHMENDVDGDKYDQYSASNSPDCSFWTPSSPAGDGWLLLEIYDTEDGPVALHVRPFPPKQSRRRTRQVTRTPSEQAAFDEGVDEGKRQMAIAVTGGMRHD